MGVKHYAIGGIVDNTPIQTGPLLDPNAAPSNGSATNPNAPTPPGPNATRRERQDWATYHRGPITAEQAQRNMLGLPPLESSGTPVDKPSGTAPAGQYVVGPAYGGGGITNETFPGQGTTLTSGSKLMDAANQLTLPPPEGGLVVAPPPPSPASLTPPALSPAAAGLPANSSLPPEPPWGPGLPREYITSPDRLDQLNDKVKYGLTTGQTVGLGGKTIDNVKQLYKKELGREADQEGLKYWFKRLANENNPDAIAKEMDASAEGQEYNLNHDALDDSQFVRRLYRVMLNRDPKDADPNGWQFWTNRLQRGMTREDLINAFKQYVPTGHDYEDKLKELMGQGNSWDAKKYVDGLIGQQKINYDQVKALLNTETDIWNAALGRAEKGYRMGRQLTDYELAKIAKMVNDGVLTFGGLPSDPKNFYNYVNQRKAEGWNKGGRVAAAGLPQARFKPPIYPPAHGVDPAHLASGGRLMVAPRIQQQQPTAPVAANIVKPTALAQTGILKPVRPSVSGVLGFANGGRVMRAASGARVNYGADLWTRGDVNSGGIEPIPLAYPEDYQIDEGTYDPRRQAVLEYLAQNGLGQNMEKGGNGTPLQVGDGGKPAAPGVAPAADAGGEWLETPWGRYNRRTGWAEFRNEDGTYTAATDQQGGEGSRRDARLFGSVGMNPNSTYGADVLNSREGVQGLNPAWVGTRSAEDDAGNASWSYDLTPEMRERLGDRVRLTQLGRGGYSEVKDPSLVEWDPELGLVTTRDNMGEADRGAGLGRFLIDNGPLIIGAIAGGVALPEILAGMGGTAGMPVGAAEQALASEVAGGGGVLGGGGTAATAAAPVAGSFIQQTPLEILQAGGSSVVPGGSLTGTGLTAGEGAALADAVGQGSLTGTGLTAGQGATLAGTAAVPTGTALTVAQASTSPLWQRALQWAGNNPTAAARLISMVVGGVSGNRLSGSGGLDGLELPSAAPWNDPGWSTYLPEGWTPAARPTPSVGATNPGGVAWQRKPVKGNTGGRVAHMNTGGEMTLQDWFSRMTGIADQQNPLYQQLLDKANSWNSPARQAQLRAQAIDTARAQGDIARQGLRNRPGLSGAALAAIEGRLGGDSARNAVMGATAATRGLDNEEWAKLAEVAGLADKDRALAAQLATSGGQMQVSRDNTRDNNANAYAISAGNNAAMLERARIDDTRLRDFNIDDRDRWDLNFGEDRRRYDQNFGQRQYEFDANRGDLANRFAAQYGLDRYRYGTNQGNIDQQNRNNRLGNIGAGIYYGSQLPWGDIWEGISGMFNKGGRVPRANAGMRVPGVTYAQAGVRMPPQMADDLALAAAGQSEKLDDQPAVLARGEGVFNPEAMEIMDGAAPGLFDAMNQMGLQKRAMREMIAQQGIGPPKKKREPITFTAMG